MHVVVAIHRYLTLFDMAGLLASEDHYTNSCSDPSATGSTLIHNPVCEAIPSRFKGKYNRSENMKRDRLMPKMSNNKPQKRARSRNSLKRVLAILLRHFDRSSMAHACQKTAKEEYFEQPTTSGIDEGKIIADPYNWPVTKLERSNTALVIIDMQVDFCSHGGYIEKQGYSIEAARNIIPNVVKLLESFQELGMPVYFTREGHRPDLSTLSAREHLRSRNNDSGFGIGDKGPLGRLLVRGERGWAIIPELGYPKEEQCIDKPGRSAFQHTEFQLMLNINGITNLVICGVTTDVCVHSTMREANDNAFDCVLVQDACAASEPQLHEGAIESMKAEGGIFGSVTTTNDVVAGLAVLGLTGATCNILSSGIAQETTRPIHPLQQHPNESRVPTPTTPSVPLVSETLLPFESHMQEFKKVENSKSLPPATDFEIVEKCDTDNSTTSQGSDSKKWQDEEKACNSSDASLASSSKRRISSQSGPNSIKSGVVAHDQQHTSLVADSADKNDEQSPVVVQTSRIDCFNVSEGRVLQTNAFGKD